MPSLGSLVTGGYEDLGSQVTPALRVGDTHQTQLLFTPPACQCLAVARPGQETFRSPARDEHLTQI